jgi:hypothetical protein
MDQYDLVTLSLAGGSCMGRCPVQSRTPLGPDQVNVLLLLVSGESPPATRVSFYLGLTVPWLPALPFSVSDDTDLPGRAALAAILFAVLLEESVFIRHSLGGSQKEVQKKPQLGTTQ